MNRKMQHGFFTKLVTVLMLLLSAPTAYAQMCVDVFADGLQSNAGNGYVSFGYGAQLNGNPDNVLVAPKVYHPRYYSAAYQPLSCGSEHCEASGEAAPSISVNFNTNYGREKIRVRVGRSYTVQASPQGR